MKKKLTLSIDEKLIKTAKKKALDNDMSVSELFEAFIKATTKDKNLITRTNELLESKRNNIKAEAKNE